ncbi:MAG TPA: zinc-dependent alcohol dehydrogenase family protein [Bryobacteraceae bacterium]|nr:zinc-dependent alcohol dehydrogenase family protein [Bryobacteraceae bacterium]
MPKVIRFHKIGGPENLKLEEVAVRNPAEGEVKLRVEAVGLNRAEDLFMRGLYRETPELPSQIGYEAAGVVEAVGPGVDSSWVGKRIATVPGFSMSKNGVLGEEAIVPASALGEYPSKLSPAEGAAIWMQYLTAYGALITYGGLKRGDFVVITAASSSVGLAAIQIVNAEGGIPIAATRKSNKRAELLALGAAHVIATEEEDLVKRVNEITGGNGARLIFDPVGGPFMEKLVEAAAYQGIVFVYGLLSMQPTPFPARPALSKGLTLRGYSLIEIRRDPKLLKTAMQYVFDRLADGRFHPKIAKTFPLAQSVEAYQYLESNQQVGKVVITV